MKLKNILPPTIKANKKFDSSLIVNLQKIKYNELDVINNFLDNKINLLTIIKGFHPIHYAALNADYRVLEHILNLYIKHNLNYNVVTSNYKLSIPEGSNIMDIAYIKQLSLHFLTLHKHDIKCSFLNKSGFTLIHYNLTHQDPDYEICRSIFSRIPYPNNVITPIIYSETDFSKMFNFFATQNYEEKDIYIEEFKQNLYFIYEESLTQDIKALYLLHKVFTSIHKIKMDDFPEMYFIPFFSTINYIYKEIHPVIFFDGETTFQKKSKDFNELSKLLDYNSREMIITLFKENNKIDFLKKYPQIVEKLNDSYEKFCIIRSKLPESKGLTEYNNFFTETNRVILQHQLNVNLPENTTVIKKNKL